MSVSVLTVFVTASCFRVLHECYLEGVRDEMMERGENDEIIRRDNYDPYYNDVTTNTQQRQHQSQHQESFHYHIALRILSKLPIELAFGLFSLLCAWSITSLTCFHALIITLGQTTNERVRGVYQYGGVINPADEGCWRNWVEMMCSRIPDSRLPKDFSDVVDLMNDGATPGSRCSSGDGGAVGIAPIAMEESVWPGWHESRLGASPTNANGKSKTAAGINNNES